MKSGNAALKRAILAAGSKNKLAKMLGISRAAVSVWEVVPIARVAIVEAKTGVPREELRPDIFRSPAASRPTARPDR